jgi:thiamine biosynthesis lipoprotein
MNTNVYVRLFSQTNLEVLKDVERLFASFERRLSRFRPDSELSQLNQNGDYPFKASPTLIGIVETALWAAMQTRGLFDPTILQQLELAGYDRSFEQIANPKPLAASTDIPTGTPCLPAQRRLYSFRSVQINSTRTEITKPAALKLDLGGIGKGWTVDRAADRLQGLGPFLINAGGDIYGYHAPPGEPGWQIDLIHPLHPELMMARLHLHHRALATSTLAKRRWSQDGQILHHLINPFTGRPADTDALSVTVTAPRTTLAEVYAKVALIQGVKQGLAYLEQLPGVEGLIFSADRQIVFTSGFELLLDQVDPAGFSGN